MIGGEPATILASDWSRHPQLHPEVEPEQQEPEVHQQGPLLLRDPRPQDQQQRHRVRRQEERLRESQGRRS